MTRKDWNEVTYFLLGALQVHDALHEDLHHILQVE